MCLRFENCVFSGSMRIFGSIYPFGNFNLIVCEKAELEKVTKQN